MTKKNYFLVFSFIAVVAIGILLGGKNTTEVTDVISTEPAVIDSSDNLYIARDIDVYTKEATVIVVGEVQATDVQSAVVTVKEILKGDKSVTAVSVLMDLTEDVALLQTSEKVLLFLGQNNEGDYVVFAGPYGKYLIDEDNNVSSEGDFKMSLAELEAKIENALLQTTN